MSVTLRPIEQVDLPVFFEHQQHKPAQFMAAFVHEDMTDRKQFEAHWAKLMSSDTVLKYSVEVDGKLVGHIMSFEMVGDREITCWIDHHYWGKGIATAAIELFIEIESTRPLHGRAAKDNIASIRSMEKCGFVLVAHERGFAHGRGKEIDEVVMVLKAD